MFLIVAGSYERFLYGLSGSLDMSLPEPQDESSETKPELKPEFSYPTHMSSLKCIASSHRYLATGSTDEHVKLYDLKSRKEIGSLLHHTGAITALQFYGKSHLLTASDDGTIAILRTHDWEVLTTLVGHKAGLTSLDVHPSGKICLSTALDRTVKCWDLTKATCSYSCKLNDVPRQVLWCANTSSPDYAVLFDASIKVFNVATGDAIDVVESPKIRINSFGFVFIDEPLIIAGFENGFVSIYKTNGTLVKTWNSNHGNRVKALTLFTENGETLFASCSSTGSIFVWNLSSLLKSENDPQPLARYDTKCRITCISHSPFYAAPVKIEASKIEDQSESEFEELLSVKKPKVLVSFEPKKVAKKVKKPKKKILTQ